MTKPSEVAGHLLKDLHLMQLPPKKKQEIFAKMINHFNRLVLVTTLSYLTEEQFSSFKKALNSKNSSDEIISFCSEIPGLSAAIEARLETEYRLFKAVATH